MTHVMNKPRFTLYTFYAVDDCALGEVSLPIDPWEMSKAEFPAGEILADGALARLGISHDERVTAVAHAHKQPTTGANL